MRILITSKAEKELNKLPDKIVEQIRNHVYELKVSYLNQKTRKLRGSNNYRLRVGAFRVIFSVDKTKKELTILRVADRKKVYR